ncbi:hypothetical protein PRZ48_008858 [Zasmidium cellare]|uniref:Uncharacterized protein n=1 Tax=Zasmidium cellare TaxID=395010 RepID=A0ABR0EH26_ZASCE|nr:hypothetical protein PRZ48_008858 [Zasmidium cellare]
MKPVEDEATTTISTRTAPRESRRPAAFPAERLNLILAKQPTAPFQQMADYPLIVHSTHVSAGNGKQPGRDSMGDPLKFSHLFSTNTRQDGAVKPRHFVEIDNFFTFTLRLTE